MKEHFSSLLHTKWFTPSAVGVATFAAGFGAGLLTSKIKRKAEKEEPQPQQLSFHFSSAAKESAEKVTVTHQEPVIKDVVVHPVVRPNPAHITVVPPIVEEQEEELEEVHVFQRDDIEWDWEAELSTRSDGGTYILHKDEFFNDEMGYAQTTLTYYSGDDIMCDEADTPMYAYEKFTGPLKFGYGSGDPNVLYVRNEKLESEWEILFDEGFYAVEILGNQIEHALETEDLKHSSQHKFKME